MNNSRYFSSTPPVVLNLIIINALMLLATELLPVGNRIVGALALFNVESPLFHSYQLVTYMFLHGGFSHLFSICSPCGCSGVRSNTSWGRSGF